MYVVSFKETSRGMVIKSHSTNTLALAEAIAADIKARFSVEATIEEHPSAPVYDPGGMISTSAQYVDLGLVQVLESHVDILGEHLKRLLVDPPRESNAGPYYKIHGQYHAVCLSVAEAHTVYSFGLYRLNQ